MTKSFNFSDITKHTLEVTLGEAEKVVLHVTTPPERLIEQLAASHSKLIDMDSTQDIEKVKMSYRLIADLISCNLEDITVTADDLRDKYKVAPIVLAAFTAAYMDFINDFHQAKN